MIHITGRLAFAACRAREEHSCPTVECTAPSSDLDTVLSPEAIMTRQMQSNNIKQRQTKELPRSREGPMMTTAIHTDDQSAEPTPGDEPTSSAATPRQDRTRPQLRVIDGQRSSSVPQQMALPLSWQVDGVPATPPAPGYLRVVRDADEQAELAASAGDRPHPIAWTAQVARAIYEVAQGERPAAQLRRHVAREQLATLAIRGTSYARHPAARHARGMSRLRQVRAVRCCLVAPGIVEASAVIVGAARSHAVALRLEAQPGAWLVTAVEFR